jgi:hypothetical protein
MKPSLRLSKPALRLSTLLAILALLLAANHAPQDPGDTLTVTRKTTKLREAKRLFAPAVAELHEGDKLVLDHKEGAWLAVRFALLAGWLHETDVSSNPEVRLSGEGVRESYSASETAAARKGFNPDVERAYRTSKPGLEAAFLLVDRLQARAVPEGELHAFLIDGGLLEEVE